MAKSTDDFVDEMINSWKDYFQRHMDFHSQSTSHAPQLPTQTPVSFVDLQSSLDIFIKKFAEFLAINRVISNTNWHIFSDNLNGSMQTDTGNCGFLNDNLSQIFDSMSDYELNLFSQIKNLNTDKYVANFILNVKLNRQAPENIACREQKSKI